MRSHHNFNGPKLIDVVLPSPHALMPADITAIYEAAIELYVIMGSIDGAPNSSGSHLTGSVMELCLRNILDRGRSCRRDHPARAACLTQLAFLFSKGKIVHLLSEEERAWRSDIASQPFNLYAMLLPSLFSYIKKAGQSADFGLVIYRTILEECLLMRVTPSPMKEAITIHKLLLTNKIYPTQHGSLIEQALIIVEGRYKRLVPDALDPQSCGIEAVRDIFAPYSNPNLITQLAEDHMTHGKGSRPFAYYACDAEQENALRIMNQGAWMYGNRGDDPLLLFRCHMKHLARIDDQLQTYYLSGPADSATPEVIYAAMFERARCWNLALLDRLKWQFSIDQDIPQSPDNSIAENLRNTFAFEHPELAAIFFTNQPARRMGITALALGKL